MSKAAVFLMLSTMVACNTGMTGVEGENEAVDATALIDPPEPMGACPDWRWIGIKTNTSDECPQVTGWQVGELFNGAGSTNPLSRYCLYEYHGTTPTFPAVEALVPAQLSEVARDCMVVSAFGDLTDEAWEPLASQFRGHAGKTGLAPGSAEVRLSVVDTAPDHAYYPEWYPGDNSAHGHTLANMASELLCGVNGSPYYCVAWTSSELALAYTDFDPETYQPTARDDARGGYVGTPGDLALAIRRATTKWQEAGWIQRLVINLSVGWEGTFGGAEPAGAMEPPIRAVYEAIENAVCKGALVIAASGNRADGPYPIDGPIYPAAWELRDAPTYGRCLELEASPDIEMFPYPGEEPYWPLVYAAGGVNAEAGILANAADGSIPRMVAYADHGVVESRPGGPTDTLTGSSVSALVVSATAAAAWSYRPTMRSFDLMNAIYESAAPLSQPADFCLRPEPWGICPRVRQIKTCTALRSVCASSYNDYCPAASSFVCETPGRFPRGFDFGRRDVYVEPYGVDCTGPLGDLEASPCITEIYPAAHVVPWIKPQPPTNGCPNCIYSGDKLYVQPADVGLLTKPSLTVNGMTYKLPAPSTYYKVTVYNLSSLPINPGDTAMLSFVVDGSKVVTAKLYQPKY